MFEKVEKTFMDRVWDGLFGKLWIWKEISRVIKKYCVKNFFRYGHSVYFLEEKW